MNWIDLVVIAIILVLAWIGLKKGIVIQCLSWLLFSYQQFYRQSFIR